jgi:hypothetical protein
MERDTVAADERRGVDTVEQIVPSDHDQADRCDQPSR